MVPDNGASLTYQERTSYHEQSVSGAEYYMFMSDMTTAGMFDCFAKGAIIVSTSDLGNIS